MDVFWNDSLKWLIFGENAPDPCSNAPPL
jgi:hypothetical protein